MVRFSNLKYLKILLRYTKRAINPANVQLPWQVTCIQKNDSPDITTSISRSKGNSVPSYLLAHKAHIRYRKRSKGKRQQSYQMRPDQQ